MGLRHLPNLISLLRIALVWPVLYCLLNGRYGLCLLLFVVAAGSDGLDGFLAKHYGWTSELGKWLDPIADKLLLMSLFLLAAWLGLVPHWLTSAVVARDVMIGLGAIVFHLVCGPVRGRPLLASKINTLLQLLYILLLLLRTAYAIPPQPVLEALAWLILVTIVISGWGYARTFGARALALSMRKA